MSIMWHYKNPILTISARWYHAMHALKEKGGRREKKKGKKYSAGECPQKLNYFEVAKPTTPSLHSDFNI